MDAPYFLRVWEVMEGFKEFGVVATRLKQWQIQISSDGSLGEPLT